MCFFITVAVPGAQAATFARAWPRSLHVEEDAEPVRGRRPFPAGWRAFSITSNGCSCSLFRAPPDQSEDDAEKCLRHQRRKYERLGWSPARIERALAQSAARRKQARHSDFQGIRPDVAALIVAGAAQAGQAAVLAWWDDPREKPAIARGPTFSPAAFASGCDDIAANQLIHIRS